jgi:hypothetical protein
MSEDDSAFGFADDTPVMVRYPCADQGPRDEWPWMPATIVDRCGPDEWRVVVEVRHLATLEDGSPAPDGTPDYDLWFPVCFRDASEITLPGGAR